MEDKNVNIMWALREVNKALLTGLEAAVSTMETWDDLSPERRQSIIISIEGLISESKKAYDTETPKH